MPDLYVGKPFQAGDGRKGDNYLNSETFPVNQNCPLASARTKPCCRNPLSALEWKGYAFQGLELSTPLKFVSADPEEGIQGTHYKIP